MSVFLKTFARVPRILLVLALALALLPAAGCNIHEKEDYLAELWDWTNYWYSQGQESRDSYARAQRLAEKYLEEDPNDLMAETVLGYCLLKNGPWDSDNPNERTARSVFQNILERERDNYRANLGLGLVHYKLSKTQDRLALDQFATALEACKMLHEAMQSLQAAEAESFGSAEASELNVKVSTIFADFARDMKKFTTRDAFPVMVYESLVPRDERRVGDRVDQYQVKQAVQKRVNDLLEAMQLALRRLPLDTRGFLANLDRMRVLLGVGHDYYKQRYNNQLDAALGRFHHCESLHERDNATYYWVYEYIALTYYLKLSTLADTDPRPIDGAFGALPGHRTSTTESDERYSVVRADASSSDVASGNPEMEAARQELIGMIIRYLDMFVENDVLYETARLRRTENEDLKKIATENPYWTQPVEDFKTLMQELVDDARAHRTRVIELLVDLLLNERLDYKQAEHMCDLLAESEVRFGDTRPMSEQPTLHLFYRAEIYRTQALKMEERFARDATGKLLVPSDERDEHRGWWLDAWRNYTRFLKRAPIAPMREARMVTQTRIIECKDRYPEFASGQYSE